MIRKRIIPCLLLKDSVLVKTIQFNDPKYIGDPIMAVKIFNDKEVDELIIIDISTEEKINYELLTKLANQSFMPLTYGGHIKTIEEAKKIFNLGFEKICINSIALENRKIINEMSNLFGNQSVVVCVDIKKNIFGKYMVYNSKIKKLTNIDPIKYVKELELSGAGEILLQSVDNDGLMTGYNLDLIYKISTAVSIPVIALGGAGKNEDLDLALKNGASAAAAGSLFVFYGPHKAVLINYDVDFT